MIKHETITVSGTVLYCDECGKRGPESAYDNADDCFEQGEMMGWDVFEDVDQCPECVKKFGKKSRKSGK